MNSGTRRMWSRRFLRVIFFLAPVFTAPVRFFKYCFFDSRGRVDQTNVAFVLVFGIIFSFIGMFFHMMWYDTRNASPESIAEAIKEYRCTPGLAEELRRYTGPINNITLRREVMKCEQAIEDAAALAEQRKAMQ